MSTKVLKHEFIANLKTLIWITSGNQCLKMNGTCLRIHILDAKGEWGAMTFNTNGGYDLQS